MASIEFDDIIVGAGSSGAVLAARLSEDPARRVLLLEAGPDYESLEATPRDLLGPDASLHDHDWKLRAAHPRFQRGSRRRHYMAVHVDVHIHEGRTAIPSSPPGSDSVAR